MRSRLIVLTALTILALTFVVDVLTPQTLVVAIFLDVPIVLAALTQNRRFTVTLVLLSIMADICAGYLNAQHEGYINLVGLLDRGLTLLSIVLVGVLSTAVQERATRVGQASARHQRAQREAILANAVERIRETLSGELVTRAIVREALTVLSVDEARWYPAAGGDAVRATLQRSDTSLPGIIPPEISSVVRRALEEDHVLSFAGTDAVARLLLAGLHAHAALAVPVRDRAETYGVLLVANADRLDEETEQQAQAFAGAAATALAQAKLFDELATRNQELVERQAVIRDLVYAFSHDLRTPLAALALTMRQARDGAFGPLPSAYGEILSASLVSIDDLRRLAETLLLVARIEAGEHRSQPEALNLRAMADDVVAEFDAVAQSRGLTVDVAGDSVDAWADLRDVRRAVVNLVANALQHTAAGGHIGLHLSQTDERVHLEVIDDGFGVPEELRPFLFQRFSGTNIGGGTGLGLYIVRRVAEENGGSASYVPRRPKGSIFRLELRKAFA